MPLHKLDEIFYITGRIGRNADTAAGILRLFLYLSILIFDFIVCVCVYCVCLFICLLWAMKRNLVVGLVQYSGIQFQ